MNVFEGSDIAAPNIFTDDVTTQYPPGEEVEGPLFGRTYPGEFGRTEPIFGES